MKRPNPIPAALHGTPAGYVRHRRRKEAACADCRNAWSAYYRDRRSRQMASDGGES